MKRNVIKDLRLALARGCEFDCDPQIITLMFVVDGNRIDYQIAPSSRKSKRFLEEREIAQEGLILLWQHEHNGTLPCGLVTCVVSYLAIREMGIDGVAEWCNATLQEVAGEHRQPPNDISEVPVVTVILGPSDAHSTPSLDTTDFDEHRTLIRDRYKNSIRLLAASIQEQQMFPCGLVSMVAMRERLICDGYSITADFRDGFMDHLDEVANEIVVEPKEQFFRDNGVYPAAAVVSLLLREVPVEEVADTMSDVLEDMVPQIVPDAKNCAVKCCVFCPEEND